MTDKGDISASSSPSERDDASIPNSEILLRRIPPDANWVHMDDNLGILKVTSIAFRNPKDTDKLSVYLSSVVQETGREFTDIIKKYPREGLASFSAGLARELGQAVVRDPYPEEDPEEKAHAHVVGKKTDGVRRKFRKRVRLEIEPILPG